MIQFVQEVFHVVWPQCGFDFHDHHFFAVVGDDVKFVVPAARLFAFQPGGGIGDGNAALNQQIDQIAFHQRFHQLAPLTGEQLFQGVDFLFSGLGLFRFPETDGVCLRKLWPSLSVPHVQCVQYTPDHHQKIAPG